MITRGLPSNEVAEMTGMSMRQLRYLVKTGVVRPSVRASEGPGDVSLYSAHDIFDLLLVERVRRVCGQEIRTERLQAVLAAARRRDPLGASYVLVDEHGCRMISDFELHDAVTGTSVAIVVDVAAVEQELRRRLANAGLLPAQRLAAAA